MSGLLKRLRSKPVDARKTVADVLNTFHGLTYVHVDDVVLDEDKNFWLRRSARIENGLSFPGDARRDWIPVSGFTHGGKVHTNPTDRNWHKTLKVYKPDREEWASVYRITD